jgi:hypothetical protein
MTTRLREARQAMHAAFPLTEALWCACWPALTAQAVAPLRTHAPTPPQLNYNAIGRFDWLSDEIEGIEDAEDVGRIRTLMAEAVRDYLSIPLWAQYLE